MRIVERAIKYAIETGRPVFPCGASKRPTCPGGFHAATMDPDGIRALWVAHPGPLIAMPTGAASGIAVLDVDAVKHRESAVWFAQNRDRIGKTRMVQSRSGGWHCWFGDNPEIGSTTNLFSVPGLDVRARGASIILWELHGFALLADAPLAPWPSWLRPPAPARDRTTELPRFADDAAIDRLIRFTCEAREGERNRRIFWAACRLSEMAGLTQGEILSLVKSIGARIGLDVREAERTALSAIGRVRV